MRYLRHELHRVVTRLGLLVASINPERHIYRFFAPPSVSCSLRSLYGTVSGWTAENRGKLADWRGWFTL